MRDCNERERERLIDFSLISANQKEDIDRVERTEREEKKKEENDETLWKKNERWTEEE